VRLSVGCDFLAEVVVRVGAVEQAPLAQLVGGGTKARIF
jgi:hypothetical protein